MYFGEPNEVVVVANKRRCKLLVELSGHSGEKIRLKFLFGLFWVIQPNNQPVGNTAKQYFQLFFNFIFSSDLSTNLIKIWK